MTTRTTPIMTTPATPDVWEGVDDAECLTLSVSAEAAGMRLDAYLSEMMPLSRAMCVRLIEGGQVTMQSCGRTVAPDKKTRLRAGDTLTVTVPAPVSGDILPEDIPLDIVYEDQDLLVVNKPVGMVVHPAPGNLSGTLVNALMAHCGQSLSGIGGVIRPGIVHRIDKDTSGLLVVAKNDAAHLSLSEQLKTHTVSRVYDAVCIGNLKEEEGCVNLPIGRNPNDRKKMAVFASTLPGEGSVTVRHAVTHYRVVERYPLGARWGQSFTYVRCQLETGRTHQIRVHMASLGHPLLGDPLYGGDGTRFGKQHSALLTGQTLHAGRLSLIHPRTHALMEFTAPLPPAFASLLDILRCETIQTQS